MWSTFLTSLQHAMLAITLHGKGPLACCLFAGGGADGGLPVCRAAGVPDCQGAGAAGQHQGAHHRCALAKCSLRLTTASSYASVQLWAMNAAAFRACIRPPCTPPSSAVGVITPYREQRKLLRETFEEVCGKGPASEVRTGSLCAAQFLCYRHAKPAGLSALHIDATAAISHT